MTTEEFIAELKIINHHLHKISNAVEEGITNNPDYDFLKGKMEVAHNTASHILGQIRYRIKFKKSRKE